MVPNKCCINEWMPKEELMALASPQAVTGQNRPFQSTQGSPVLTHGSASVSPCMDVSPAVLSNGWAPLAGID